MNHIFRNLLIRYQNYLLEFYQLIEDKNLISPSQQTSANQIKLFLENMPEFSEDFEIGFSLSKKTGELTATWSVYINEEGFSIRSFSIEGLDEIDEWHFHYYNNTQEYEGNLYTDGDWDLFLEEIADVDDAEGEELFSEIIYKV